jgi:hypothetical protein
MTDVSTKVSSLLRDYERYLDDVEPMKGVDDYFYEGQPLTYPEWLSREDPCDPDTDE